MSTTGIEGIVVDVAAFRKEIDNFAVKHNVSAKTVMYDQMRLWMQDLIKTFPPRVYSRGREAIESDIRRLFVSLDDQDVLDYFAERFGRKPPRRMGKKRGGAIQRELPGVKFNFTGDQGMMRAWTSANRSKTTGRVKYSSHPVATIGKWTFVSEMYAPARSIKKLIREKQKHVGTLKAGWVPAADFFARKSRAGVRVPGFVRRVKSSRSGINFGTYSDEMTDKGTGYLEAVNEVPYADRWRGLLHGTVLKRISDLTKNLRKMHKTIIDKENARV